MLLSELNENETKFIYILNIDGLMRERLLSLGLTKNTKITKIKDGPKKSISIYLIRDVMVALRMEEANLILVQ